MAAKLEPTRTPGIYKRGNRYAVIYRDAEGRQRQESARTYDDARRLKSARASAVASGEHHPVSRVRLADYAREWVGRYQGKSRRGFREQTRAEYRRDLERYAIPYLDKRLRRTLEQVTPRDVAQFVGWLCDEQEQGRYLADATVRRILSPLRACLASAVAEGLIRHNPCAGVALPARDAQRAVDDDEDEHEVKALTTEQLAAFLLVCPPKWQPFFRLLAATGLRISEALALRWRDVELDGSAPCVRVRRAYVKGRMGPPKSKYGRRRVPIDFALVRELREAQARCDPRITTGDALVFPSTTGTPMNPENLRYRVLKPTAGEAGVPWAGFHTFRHTAATRLFAGGKNAVQVQRWLGHHSPAFTLSTYVHLLDGDLGEPLDSSVGVSRVSAEATVSDRIPVASESVYMAT